jgi:hypothetical protein
MPLPVCDARPQRGQANDVNDATSKSRGTYALLSSRENYDIIAIIKVLEHGGHD